MDFPSDEQIVLKRILDRTKKGQGDGCWIWQGVPAGKGYGQIIYKGVRMQVHRAVYEVLVGPIPDGLQIDHRCRTRLCVRPDHLEVVTCRENVRRGNGPAAINARRTHCKRGHEYVQVPYGGRQGRGRRVCNICRGLDRRRKLYGEDV